MKRVGSARAPSGRIAFGAFEFQELKWGHEGPGYFSAKGEPPAGVEQVAEASLYGHEAVATARFEMLDEIGNVIQTLYLFKTDNSPDNGAYVGFVNVPSQPFRIAASGQDASGASYRRVFRRLFRPESKAVVALVIPPGFPPQQAERIRQYLDSYDREFRARCEALKRAHPDGTFVVPRTGVSRVTYEPFASQGGNPLGVRVQYDIQFSADGHYSIAPHVFPLYKTYNWQGQIGFKIQNESINPQPEAPAGSEPQKLLRYRVPALYKAGVVYRVVADVVPDWIIYNAQNTRTCVYNRKFESTPSQAAMWEGIKGSETPIVYRIDVDAADFHGETAAFYPQKTFYESFQKEGAQDCGPTPNIHF